MSVVIREVEINADNTLLLSSTIDDTDCSGIETVVSSILMLVLMVCAKTKLRNLNAERILRIYMGDADPNHTT